MLEIILVYFMCKSIGKKLRAKGRKPLVFQFMLVVMWIGGEIAGGIATAARLTESRLRPCATLLPAGRPRNEFAQRDAAIAVGVLGRAAHLGPLVLH